MARPSVTEERTRQIVEATIRTIGAHGITGASLERIAEEAGMSRGHVRHFVGNREQLLRESARRFYYDGMEGEAVLPAGTKDVSTALGFLFSDEFAAPGSDNAVVLGFVEAARTDPVLAQLLVSAYQGTHRLLAELLLAEHPAASRSDCESVAYGVVAVALHNVFLSDIASEATGTAAARAAAERLIATLG